MKRKYILALVLALCMALVLCGCSQDAGLDYKTEQYIEAPDLEAPKEDSALSGPENSSASGSGVLADRKLIRRISISAETEDMDAMLSSLNAHIATLGGYVESRNVQNGSSYSGSRRRSATLVIRIPAAQLDSFQQQVGQASNIVSSNETTDDVTLQYVDTQSRLKMLRTEEERLLKFLGEATSVTEMLEVERRLTQVQADIESLTSQLKTYDNLVDYGTVTLRITEVDTYTPTQEPSLWQSVGSTFDDSLEGLGSLGRGVLVALLGYSPYLMLFVILPGIILLVIFASKRRKQRKAPNAEKQS